MKRGAFWSLDSFKKDFQKQFDSALEKLWQKQEKYGKTYFSNTDTSYYLKRLKHEITEYEKNPCIDEANDIINFALMLSMHTKKED